MNDKQIMLIEDNPDSPFPRYGIFAARLLGSPYRPG